MRRLLEKLGGLLIHTLVRLEIDDLDRVPPSGPVILLINHVNFADVSILSVVMPRSPVALAKEELFHNWFLGPLVRSFDAIPVKRGDIDRTALRLSLEVLRDRRGVLMVAPEGHRSGDGRLQSAHDGVAFLAVHGDAMVVPVAVVGAEEFWRNVKRLRRTNMRVAVGHPFRFRRPVGKLRREILTAMTTEAMYRLAQLLPPESRGPFSDLSAATETCLDLDV